MQSERRPREEAQSAQGFQGKSLSYHKLHPDQTTLKVTSLLNDPHNRNYLDTHLCERINAYNAVCTDDDPNIIKL